MQRVTKQCPYVYLIWAAWKEKSVLPKHDILIVWAQIQACHSMISLAWSFSKISSEAGLLSFIQRVHTLSFPTTILHRIDTISHIEINWKLTKSN